MSWKVKLFIEDLKTTLGLRHTPLKIRAYSCRFVVPFILSMINLNAELKRATYAVSRDFPVTMAETSLNWP